MSREWQVSIEIWPYSTGNGRDEDQKACGERTRTFTVIAHDIFDVIEQAKMIVHGIKTNPAVWQAPIKSIVQQSH